MTLREHSAVLPIQFSTAAVPVSGGRQIATALSQDAKAPGRDDCPREPRWIYERRNLAEAQANWLKRWEKRHPKLTDWVEAHIAETFTLYRLPRQHQKHLPPDLRAADLPHEASCLRLALACAPRSARTGSKTIATSA